MAVKVLEKYSDAFVLSEGKSLETSLESLHIRSKCLSSVLYRSCNICSSVRIITIRYMHLCFCF